MKFFSLYSDTWKYICYLLMMESYCFFLLNSQDDLLGKTGSICRHFNSLSTKVYGDYLILSGQSQKSIELLGFLLKNSLRFFNIAMEYNWYGYMDVLKICFRARMTFVITTMYLTFCEWIIQLIPHLMVKSSTSVEVIFIMWWTDLAIISCLL